MKRTSFIIFTLCAILLASCGKEDPVRKINKEEKKEEVNKLQEDKKNEAKQDEKQKAETGETDKQKENNTQTGQDTGTNEPDKNNTEQADKSNELTQRDIESYFGGMSHLWGLAKVREELTHIGITKEIAGKQIKITKAEMVDINEEQASFKLRLNAEVNGQTLEVEYSFSNFAKRPQHSHDIGGRMQARWKQGDRHYRDFALDQLYEEGKTEIFTASYLADFIDFYSSDTSGSPYFLSKEEVKDMEILDIKYQGNSLSFKTKFAGRTSGIISLIIEKAQYYNHKVGIKEDANQDKYYATGVAQNPHLYAMAILDYDDNRYAITATDAQADESNQSVSFTLRISLRSNGDRELVELQKTVPGFRPLRLLAQELFIGSKDNFNCKMAKRVRNIQDPKQLKERLQQSIGNWIKEAGIFVNNFKTNLEFSSTREGRTTLGMYSGGIDELHYYFLNPRFEVLEAKRNPERNNFLLVKLRLQTINDETLDIDLNHEMNIHLPSRDACSE